MSDPEEPAGSKTVEMRKAVGKAKRTVQDAVETKEVPMHQEEEPICIKVSPPDPSIPVNFDVSHFRRVTIDEDLQAHCDEEYPAALTVPEGRWGEVENLLARGLLSEALVSLDAWKKESEAGSAQEASYLIRSLRIRAHLMDGKVTTAEELLAGDGDLPEMVLAEIGLALSQGDLERAQRRSDEAENHHGGSMALEHLKGLLSVSEGRMEMAMAHLSSVARSAPDHAVARHQLGQLVLTNGDVARAGTLFEQAMEITPTFPAPALALAEMLLEQRQLGEAMAVLNILAEHRPELLAARLMQMRILLELGEAETALSLAEVLRAQMPEHPEVCLQWAEAKARTGNVEEARLYLDKLSSNLEGTLKARCLRLLSQIALSAEPPRVDEAIAMMKEAVATTEAGEDMLLDLAQLQLEVSDLEGAKATFIELSVGATDVGTMLSGAIAAHNRGLQESALLLAEAAFERVKGTPAESQILGFLDQLKALSG